MRPLAWIGSTLGATLVIGTGSAAGILVHRSSDFNTRAATLEQKWTSDTDNGVPATAIAPLRQQLDQSGLLHNPWSRAWVDGSGDALLGRLEQQTASAWNAALAAQHQQAQQQIDAWTQLDASQAQFLPANTVTEAAIWPTQIDAATTPTSLHKLANDWSAAVASARTAATQARDAAIVKAAGDNAGVIKSVQAALNTAHNDNLDTGDMATQLQTLQQEVNNLSDTTATAASLLTALQQFDQLLALNNQIAGEVHPLQWTVDQAMAEKTPNSSTFSGTYGTLAQAFHDGTNSTQLTAVQQSITALQNSVNGELAANVCGHTEPAGKVITISLSLQEMLFFQDGCVVQATPVTTGRPGLNTPAGNYSVFYKTTPFTMHSPWPPSSQYWYPDTRVQWVMEFIGGGYFIHDAYWENPSAYGPGSENNTNAASHGCVHTPTPVMQWAYSWTPLGTPVLVSE